MVTLARNLRRNQRPSSHRDQNGCYDVVIQWCNALRSTEVRVGRRLKTACKKTLSIRSFGGALVVSVAVSGEKGMEKDDCLGGGILGTRLRQPETMTVIES